MMVAAIETKYRGELFRSRTEARWAAFLDALGVTREHEPQPFEIGGMGYLPDFFLPGLGVWLEVKGRQPLVSELAVLLDVSKATGARGVVMVGAPANPGYPKHTDGYGLEVSQGLPGRAATTPVFFASCETCERVGLTVYGNGALLDCGHGAETYARDCWRIRRAAEAAARVRWEPRG